MGGLRDGRGGGGGGGFVDNESFDAIEEARSLSDGCELFFGGGGGGGDESVGCCVVASIFSLWRAARRRRCCQRPLLSLARWRLGTAGLTHRAHKQSSGLLCGDQCVSAALAGRGRALADFS